LVVVEMHNYTKSLFAWQQVKINCSMFVGLYVSSTIIRTKKEPIVFYNSPNIREILGNPFFKKKIKGKNELLL